MIDTARQMIYKQDLPQAIKRTAWVLFQLELCRTNPATSKPFTSRQALTNVLQWMDGQKLTPMERRVVQLLVNGMTQKEIARELGVARDTVKHHFADIRQKLGAVSTHQVVAVAVERRWVQAPKLRRLS